MAFRPAFPPIRDFAAWLLPLGVLLVIVGVEVGQDGPQAAPEVVAAAAPQPVVPALLPEYAIQGSLDARRETVERPLFVPTRRPAPTPVEVAPKATMPRGQFALTGTTLVDGKGTAFLREVKGGKFRRVQQGDTINGMLVAEVTADRVKFVMGDESEELVLKVAGNPKPTPGAVPPPPAGVAAVPGVGQPPQSPQQAAQSLIERRRAARAAAAQAQGQAQGQGQAEGTPPPAPGAAAPGMGGATGRRLENPQVRQGTPGQPPPSGGSWGDVFRQYQERAGTAPPR